MKLELKYLIPYLPYGLKLLIENDVEIKGLNEDFQDCDYIKRGVVAMTGINYENSYLGNAILFKRDSFGDGYLEVEDVKPILRPLSDLTKEIVDPFTGEKTVVAQSLISGNIKEGERLEIYYWGDVVDEIWHPDYLDVEMTHTEWMLLHKYHFDLYSLIKNGLAVDINKIKDNNNHV